MATRVSKLVAALAAVISGAGAARADGMTYEQLKALIVSRGVTSVEQLMPLLPEEYRRNYSLVYRTGSVQNASQDQPRILLYGKDATLTIGIGGDPNRLNSNKLEIIEFDSGAKRFVTREVRFPAPRDPSGTPVQFVDHPTSCASCHRDPIRPNLEPYPTWPGFYGGSDDRLKAGSQEEAAFKRYQQYFAGQGPYRFLQPLTAQPAGQGQSKILNADGKSPNTELSRSLASLNFDQVVSEITGAPTFDSLQYAWAGLAAGCFSPASAVEGFFPDGLKSQPAAFTSTLSDTRSVIGTDYNLRSNDLLRETGLSIRNFDGDQADTTALFRYVAERSGLRPEDWSMSPQDVAYTFSTPGSGILELKQKLSDEMTRRGLGGLGCSELQRRSLAALANRGPAGGHCLSPVVAPPLSVPSTLMNVAPRVRGH